MILSIGKRGECVMKDNSVMLFNHLSNTDINSFESLLAPHLMAGSLVLSDSQIKTIQEMRHDVLLSYRLVDFSYQSTVEFLLEIASQTDFDEKDILEDLSECLEIFYYVRSDETIRIDDESLIEKIIEKRLSFGNWKETVGYFETNQLEKEEAHYGLSIRRFE